MIYLVDTDERRAVLAGVSGIEPGHAAVAPMLRFDAESVWPIAETIRTRETRLIADLNAHFGNLPTGAWQRPPHQAVIVPIASSGSKETAAVMIAGLNPFRLFDDNYKRFIELVAAQIAASIANARVYEEERGRAEALTKLEGVKTMARVGRKAAEHEREARIEAETLNEIARTLAAELDLQKLVQRVTDACTALTGAKFGAFFYNVVDGEGESYRLYTLSGAPREAFEQFGLPRNTAVFGPTFRGEGPLRLDDVQKDRRYGQNPPHYGMPKGHLPVRSYLAVPVTSRSGEVLGGLFFGHLEPGVFTEQAERLTAGVASLAAIAIDNARLYEQTQKEIAERQQAQQEIQRLNAELEQRVVERTAELQAANYELESFSYSVSHDLRAPLRSIDGFSKIVLEEYAGKLGASGHDYLRRVRSGSQRMARLIDDLLKLSRITRSEMHRTALDMSALAREIADNLRVGQPERQAAFMIESGLIVSADAALMRIVLNNLLGNAWKFTGKRPQARIELGHTRRDGQTIYFVRDNGAGFDMAYADKLFGAFQRLHTMTEFDGSGIGLATVQRIIHRHGGRIWAEAAVDRGATFYFTLTA
jgi:signal transduction histidine kinase